MKKVGIEGVSCMLGDPDEFPLAVAKNTAAAREARIIAEDAGVRILETAASGDLEVNIPTAREMGVDYYRICEIIPDTPDEREKFIAYLKLAGKIAEDCGLTVIVENHGGLLTTAASCKDVLEKVAMANVTLNYDPANFQHYGQDPLEALEHVISLIGFTHFKNVKYIEAGSDFCRLKDGAINYSRILEKLLPHYNGAIALEYERAEDVEAGTADDLAYMRELLEKYA
jgi:sugar phosphate isomerase/epimerase